eukprot:TRINITY_DN4671_c0_g1_i1.p1 TRINITY_DN4671_c0_g1~~TRINITY_DN4671_c0_g1_i1.p1  ORF type:complete len:564 (-),score=90.15 TRINITY_DN4671_c0_g1_i1:145-1701(-)
MASSASAFAACCLAVFLLSAFCISDAGAQTAGMCTECVDIVNIAREFINENTTESEIKTFLEKICNLFPASADGLCDEVIMTSSTGILNAFISGETSAAICTELRLCFDCCLTDYTPEQVHLSMTEDITQMVVMWVTHYNTSTSTCQYALTSAYTGVDSFNMSVTGYTNTYTSGNWSGVIHRATLVDLEPFVNYTYRCGDETAGWSDVYSFVANSGNLPTEELRIVVVGDMGAAIWSDGTVGNIITEVNANRYDFMLHVGDIGYADDEAWTKYTGLQEWEHVWDQFQRKVEPIAARIPYMVCLGNHEAPYNFTAYRSRFAMPGPNKDVPDYYYSFDYGYAHFLAFSSEHPFYPGSEQYEFIQNDLANAVQNRANRPWIIMMMHRPLYCHNDRNDQYDCQVNAPLFRSYLEDLVHEMKVDFFIQAHEHSYERSWPVWNNGTTVEDNYNNPNGTVYVVNGSAGCPERLDTHWLTPTPEWAAAWHSSYGYARLTLTQSTLNWQFVHDQTSEVMDEITIVKS